MRWRQAVLLLAFAAPVAAQTQVAPRLLEYEIQGTTARALAREMRHKGPSLSTGHRAYAFTSWTLDWSLEPQVDQTICRPSAARVTALITITLPRWINPDQGNEKLRSKWLAFRSALERHERTHQQHAVDAGQRLYETLLALPAAPCREFSQRAAALAKSIIEEGQQRDAELDMRTNYGRKEGVKF